MANNLVQFQNLDFADLTRNSERCDPQHPNICDPMSYATEGRYGISVITSTSDWLCASGIHLALFGQRVQESRTVSPKFALLTPDQEGSIVQYHVDELAQYQQDPDPKERAWRSAKVGVAAQRVIACGSRLLGGVYFQEGDNGIKGDIFFALSLTKELPVRVIKEEIARRSFTAGDLAMIFNRARIREADEEPTQARHLSAVPEPITAAA